MTGHPKLTVINYENNSVHIYSISKDIVENPMEFLLKVGFKSDRIAYIITKEHEVIHH
jgi:hypothetical protein